MCAMMKRSAAERNGNVPADRSYFTARDSIELELSQVRDKMALLEREIKDPSKAARKEANIRELADYRLRYQELLNRQKEC